MRQAPGCDIIWKWQYADITASVPATPASDNRRARKVTPLAESVDDRRGSTLMRFDARFPAAFFAIYVMEQIVPSGVAALLTSTEPLWIAI